METTTQEVPEMPASTDHNVIANELLIGLGLDIEYAPLASETDNPAALSLVALLDAMARQVAAYREAAASVQREMEQVVNGRVPFETDPSAMRTYRDATAAAQALREPLSAAAHAYRASRRNLLTVSADEDERLVLTGQWTDRIEIDPNQLGLDAAQTVFGLIERRAEALIEEAAPANCLDEQ